MKRWLIVGVVVFVICCVMFSGMDATTKEALQGVYVYNDRGVVTWAVIDGTKLYLNHDDYDDIRIQDADTFKIKSFDVNTGTLETKGLLEEKFIVKYLDSPENIALVNEDGYTLSKYSSNPQDILKLGKEGNESAELKTIRTGSLDYAQIGAGEGYSPSSSGSSKQEIIDKANNVINNQRKEKDYDYHTE